MSLFRLSLVVACFVTACAPGAVPEPSATESVIPAAEMPDYTYDFQRECFCVDEAREPVRITVREGEVVEVRSRRTNVVLAPENWPTLADIERQVDEARSRGDEVAVERDSGGLPTRIEIGSLAADAGVIYHLGNVRRIE